MIAVDTNILIRLVIDDHPEQSATADSLMRQNQVFISKGVLMESEWVLRHLYKFSRDEVGRFLSAILDTSNTVIENREQVAQALKWYRLGADWADALHLASCDGLFHTFDQRFCQAARKAGLAPEVRMLKT